MIAEKINWVIRADVIMNGGNAHPLHETFATREKAREFKKLLRGMGNWVNVKMYRSRELQFKDGSISIAMWPAR